MRSYFLVYLLLTHHALAEHDTMPTLIFHPNPIRWFLYLAPDLEHLTLLQEDKSVLERSGVEVIALKNNSTACPYHSSSVPY